MITRVLLRDRAAGEASGGKWRLQAYADFQKRRMTRILIPCYAAMLFALAVGAPDIRAHALVYFGHGSNFHMAFMKGWPSGTAHYWTLAIQMQFYLLWPVLVFCLPRRYLVAAFSLCVAAAPISRLVIADRFPEIFHSEAMTTSALDYFGIGSLLALAMECGMMAGNACLRRGAWLAFAGYATLYAMQEAGKPTAGFGYVQQTLVSVVFAGLISSTLLGFGGICGRILDHPVIQHVGRLSYGLYLFHTPVPLFLGMVLPQLWGPFFNGYGLILRLGIYALVSWGIAWLCWRYLEKKQHVF